MPDIASIARARLEAGRHVSDSDVAALVAEIERLRAALTDANRLMDAFTRVELPPAQDAPDA